MHACIHARIHRLKSLSIHRAGFESAMVLASWIRVLWFSGKCKNFLYALWVEYMFCVSRNMPWWNFGIWWNLGVWLYFGVYVRGCLTLDMTGIIMQTAIWRKTQAQLLSRYAVPVQFSDTKFSISGAFADIFLPTRQGSSRDWNGVSMSRVKIVRMCRGWRESSRRWDCMNVSCVKLYDWRSSEGTKAQLRVCFSLRCREPHYAPDSLNAAFGMLTENSEIFATGRIWLRIYLSKSRRFSRAQWALESDLGTHCIHACLLVSTRLSLWSFIEIDSFCDCELTNLAAEFRRYPAHSFQGLSSSDAVDACNTECVVSVH